MEGRRRAAEGVAAATPFFFVPVGKPQTWKRGRGVWQHSYHNLTPHSSASRCCVPTSQDLKT